MNILRNLFFIGFIFSIFLFFSCLHSRTTGPSFAVDVGIKIFNGKAILKINGQVNENLYNTSIFDTQIKDEKYYENPTIREGTITKNEIKYLSTGEEYKFSVLPTEVVTINITSLDGNDVEVVVYQYRKEKMYTLKGTNRMGLSLAFQNR
ncbi:MAG: hypothetical protein LBD29_00115 [Treponema sp.]|jgi:hypothetical protein|nr:hypothetical protein [Treponema sp.]